MFCNSIDTKASHSLWSRELLQSLLPDSRVWTRNYPICYIFITWKRDYLEINFPNSAAELLVRLFMARQCLQRSSQMTEEEIKNNGLISRQSLYFLITLFRPVGRWRWQNLSSRWWWWLFRCWGWKYGIDDLWRCLLILTHACFTRDITRGRVPHMWNRKQDLVYPVTPLYGTNFNGHFSMGWFLVTQLTVL